MIDKNNIAWGITFAAAFGAYLIWRKGRNGSTPTLLNTGNMEKKSYYPEYDYLQYNRLTRGYRNNNPVNIVYNAGNKWLGQIGVEPEGRFAQFNDLVHGYRAAIVLLRGKGYINGGNNTIEKIITKFAPSNENYTAGYIANVSRMTGIPKDQVISRDDKAAISKILYAMSIVENGYKDLDGIDIEYSYGLPDMNIINLAWAIV